MLLLLGSHGSPGTTTTAFITAHFAAQKPGIERSLLVEADPTGGTLSTILRINPNMGLISLLTSPEAQLNIWEHTQNLAVPPSPKLNILLSPLSIKGSWDSVQIFTDRLQATLLDLARTTPVIIDGGRVFNDSPAYKLITPKTTVGIVIREGYQPALPALRHVQELVADLGATAGIVSIGKPIWDVDEYKSETGLEFFGWLMDHPKGYVDLNAVVNGSNPKKFKNSCLDLTNNLFQLALQVSPPAQI